MPRIRELAHFLAIEMQQVAKRPSLVWFNDLEQNPIAGSLRGRLGTERD